jgi:hypothetical protein
MATGIEAVISNLKRGFDIDLERLENNIRVMTVAVMAATLETDTN